MAQTFHTGARITHSYQHKHNDAHDFDSAFNSFAHTVADVAQRNPERARLYLASAVAVILDKQTRRPPVGVPRAPAVASRPSAPAKGTNGATRPSFGKDSASLRTNSADRRRAEAFAPESSLLAHLRANGKDTAQAEEMLAEYAARYARAMRARDTTLPAMSAHDRKRAADFAPPSSLDVWRAQQGKVPESDIIEDDKRATRDALAHEREMKAILQGKKPATRSAPKSDRRR